MKQLLTVALLGLTIASYAQFGVNYHHSDLQFVGLNYGIGEKFLPEVRIAADRFTDNLSLETNVFYKVLKKTDYVLYAGAGYTSDWDGALTIPVGLNFYPLSTKNFGFQMEVTYLTADILRQSFGIHYLFRKE